MDNRIEEISKIIDELSTTQALWLKGLKDKIKYHLDDDFNGEGDNIMDRLPTIFEALKLRKENEKLKTEIWKWKELPAEFGLDSRADTYNMIYKLKQEIEELKKQIPQKPGKKLSQNDKVVLKRIRDSIHPGPDDVCGKEDYKLLNRLLK